MTKTRQQGGFTLIEIMIVVAIVGIMASIAYPSYVESVRKGKRAQGRAALVELLQQQERFMTQNNKYQAFAAGATGTSFKTFSGDNNFTAAYLLSAVKCGEQDLNSCVELRAVPQFSDVAVGTLSLTSSGLKSCSGTDTKLCWP